VSAEILFDMRLEMYRHLQRLSPRFSRGTRLGDIMSRINNDIGEIQRIAAETALAWVGNVLFLAGTIVMLAWLDMRLFWSRSSRLHSDSGLVHFRQQLEDRDHPASAQRRDRRLPDRPFKRSAGGDVECAGTEVANFRARNGLSRGADVHAAPHYFRAVCPG
jgi:hypothetical protein